MKKIKGLSHNSVKANAQLISASPDLLDACIKAYDYMEYIDNSTDEEIEIYEALKQAIAKAEGRD